MGCPYAGTRGSSGIQDGERSFAALRMTVNLALRMTVNEVLRMTAVEVLRMTVNEVLRMTAGKCSGQQLNKHSRYQMK